MKICIDCCQSSKYTKFSKTGIYKNGNNKYKSSCNKCVLIKRKISNINRIYYDEILSQLDNDKRLKYLQLLYIEGKTAAKCAWILKISTKDVYNNLKKIDIRRCMNQHCNKLLQYSQFYRDYTRVDGYSAYCKVCVVKVNKNYEKNNIHKVRFNQRKNSKKRYKNISTRLNSRMSWGIYSALKSGKEGKSWTELVDFTLDELKDHLELYFESGMSWDNCGKGKNKWQIDHIIPKAYFNITSPYCDDFKKCWALDNLQPLWAEDNLKKSDIMPDGSRARNKNQIKI